MVQLAEVCLVTASACANRAVERATTVNAVYVCSALGTVTPSLPGDQARLQADARSVADSLQACLEDCRRFLQRMQVHSKLDRAFPSPPELVGLPLKSRRVCLLILHLQ